MTLHVSIAMRLMDRDDTAYEHRYAADGSFQLRSCKCCGLAADVAQAGGLNADRQKSLRLIVISHYDSLRLLT